MYDPFACTASVIYREDPNSVGRHNRAWEERANWLPSRDLLVVPDARNVGMTTCMRGEDRCLGDGESARDAGSLFIVSEGERTVDVSVVSTGTLHRGQDDSVLQIGGSNADGPE
jgi:hypothetical protein